MKLKTATLLGMIGAIISTCLSLLFLFITAEIIEWKPEFSFASNTLSVISSATLALFFYTLYKNQK